ncbi:MAG: hypothetical protein QOJ16_2326 [Acidobacteriota bacterium]|jgi:amino acid adenylation domain-containing protein|nr:hypothetical protein [Acidobacteriota bacterium]
MKLTDFKLVDESADREALWRRLEDWNRTERPYDREASIAHLFEARAAACPDRAAVVCLGRPFTYRELSERSNQVARFVAGGIARIGVVAVMMDNSYDMLAALLGIWKAGAIYVPINPELPLERTRHMLVDTGATLLFCERRYVKEANRLLWECPRLAAYLAMDSADARREPESPNELMNRELWDYVGREATDDISGGGWVSSYTGEKLSREVMDEYGDNVLKKLAPRLTPETRVLEIGCASGITLFRLAPRVGSYLGVDLSSEILARTEAEREERGLGHVRLRCLPAHEIHLLLEDNPNERFDLIVLNSVVQSFHGHNYLYSVLEKCVGLLADRGAIFVGDVMDQDQRQDLIDSLVEFKRSHAGSGFVTKTDWGNELFLSRRFFEDLPFDLPGVVSVHASEKIAAHESELARFRYDVVLEVDRSARPVAARQERHRRQYGRDRLDAQPVAPLPLAGRGEDPAYILFTSGTTGRPKGVAVTHRSLHNYVQWACRYYFADVPGNMALFTSPAFDLTLTSIVCPLLGGRTVHTFRNDDVDRLLARIFGSGPATSALPAIDAVKLTPAHVSVLRGLEIRETAIRSVIVGGEELTPEQVETLRRLHPGMRIYNEYGPTEATIGCTVARVEGPPVTIGKPIDNTRIYVIDSAGELKPVGVVGELCVSGDGLALGYWNDPEQTAAKFVDHPFRPGERLYRTGDRAKWLPDGNLLLLGRVDRQVKIRGNRVELGEIEERIRRLPEVADVAVIDRRDAQGDRCLAAYVVTRDRVETARLREELAVGLPDFMIPSYFVFLPALPLSLNGKVDRRALPDPEEIAAAAGAAYEAPEGDLERALAGIWKEVLGRERVGRGDNFFDLGGHSLKATQVVSRVERTLGVRLPLREMFRNPTLRGLSAALSGMSGLSSGSGVSGGSGGMGGIEPIPDAEFYALSHSQRRLWILHQIEEDPLAYNSLEVICLEGDLDETALLLALRHLVARHESLRTLFVQAGGEPRQVVRPELDFELSRADLRPAADPEAAAREHLLGEAGRPFDLAAGPLLRVSLLRLGERRTILALILHHIVSDGWSMGVLVRELSVLYNAYRAGAEPPLPPLRIQYRDYSAWHNRQVDEAAGRRAYWLEKLAGPLPALDLPTDFPRPPVQSFAGAHRGLFLDSAVTAGLNRLARERGGSLFMVLVALVKTLLHRHTGQEEILVGSPIAGRFHADLEDQIGFYTNTLALRDRVESDAPWTALLDSVKRTTLEAYEHQLYPFDRLVEELPLARDTSRSALFDVLVVLQNTAPLALDLQGLTPAGFSVPTVASKFDLSFHFAHLGQESGGEAGLRVGLEFATDLFLPGRIERMAAQLAVLAESVLADSGRRLGEIRLLPPAEERQVTADFARGASAEVPDLGPLFAARVADRPERIAVVSEDRHLSFAELSRRARLLARRLAGRIRPGEPVGVRLDRSERVLVSLMAIIEAGGAYLPLDPGYPPDRLAFLLADSGARVVLGEADFGDSSDSDAVEDLPMTPGTLGYIIYTSGSTGRPKGVAGTRRCLANLVAWQGREMGPGLHLAQYAALSFDVSVQEMLFGVTSGGTLHVLDDTSRLDPWRLAAFLRTQGIELLTLPFSALQLLFSQPGIPDLPALRHLATSGEQLVLSREPRQFLLARPEVQLHNQYGPSETHVVTSYTLSGGRGGGGPLPELPPIGRPLANCGAYLLSPAFQPVPIGVNGELFLAGAHLAEGYLGNPALTAERFVPHSYGEGERLYRTGDLCRWTSEGDIEFLGRRDAQVKVRGFRIEPGEVEHALLAHPAIAAACVVAEREEGGVELVAYLLFAAPADLPGVADLRAHLGRSLPEYMLPSRFVPVAELPLTPSGKVDRRALSGISGAALRSAVAYVPPGTELERQLAGIWEAVLGRAPIGMEEDFFELGGHSLKATQVIAEIHRRLGLEMPLLQVFRTPTLRGLAAWLGGADGEKERHPRAGVVLLNRESERKVFALPPLLGYGVAFKELAGHLPDHAFYGLDFVEGDDRLDVYADVLAEIQPEGPYVLFGYSAGGNLAFELAKHLAARGRRVAHILLLDSFKLVGGESASPEAVRREVRLNLDYFSSYIAAHPDFARYVTDEAVHGVLVHKMESYVRFLRQTDNSGTIDADLHLVTSEDLAGPEVDARRALWAGATTGKLAIHPGYGPHTDMIFRQHLAGNARVIRTILDEDCSAG